MARRFLQTGAIAPSDPGATRATPTMAPCVRASQDTKGVGLVFSSEEMVHADASIGRSFTTFSASAAG